MPDSWRDQMRQYKDRWIIGLAMAFSLLLHVGLIAFFFFGPSLGPRFPEKDDTIDFDLSQLDPSMLEQQPSAQEPDRLDFRRIQGNQQQPQQADAYGFQNNDAGRSTHNANQPIEDIQRQTGPRGPGQGAGAPGPGQRQGNLPPIPQVGEGVGEPQSDRQTQADGQSIDQLISRTGMQAPPGGGGGEDGINPFNPNVGDPGQSLSISTKEYKYMAYFAHMKEKIEMAWTYPQAAQQMGQQGMCTLKFTVLRSGKVQEVKVVRTSGYRLLDEYAMKAIKEAHFNPMPSSWPDNQLTIAANFVYRLIGVRSVQ